MTNLYGELFEVGEIMADNLEAMGVIDADADDGLTTLASKILDIEPSISGLELDTSVTLQASETSITRGDSVVFTSVLSASYDDTTVVDVDLSGVLTGATIVYKIGDTVLGSAITDANGVASYTHNFMSIGSYTVKAYFLGTDNFDDCESSTVTVDVAYNLSIGVDKPILDYSSHEVATVTAVLGGAGSGERLDYRLEHKGVVLDSGSDVTDVNGEISFSYVSQGVGDVDVIVSYGIFLQETYVVEDCDYFGTMTSADGKWTIPSSANATYSSNGMKIAGSSWTDCYLEVPLTKPCSIEFDVIDYTGSLPVPNQYLYTASNKDRKFHVYFYPQANFIVCDYYNSDANKVTFTPPKQSHWKIVVNTDNIQLYIDDNLIITKSDYEMTSPLLLGVSTNANRSSTYKNIKVKAL